jgi:hypothetical protein
MNCTELGRWLDEGSPAESHVAAMAHARICARCAQALRAMDELESWLASAPPPAPEGFTHRVMAQVAATTQGRGRIPITEMLPFFQTFPWWVRVMLEPASLLAVLLASVLALRGDRLFALATSGGVQLAAWLTRILHDSGTAAPAPGAMEGWGSLLLQPTVLTCVALGAAPLLLMGSRLLYGWSATLVGPRRPRSRSH